MLAENVSVADWKESCTKSDGCSFPLGFQWLNNDRICPLCLQHDFWYRYGYKYGVSRLDADLDLRNNIIAAGEGIKAQVMYRAVRLFGSNYWTYYKSYSSK